MKAMKLIIQLLLMFVLVFSIMAPSFAASIYVELNPTTAKVGDTVTITVTVNNDYVVDLCPVIVYAPIPDGLQYMSHVVPDKTRQDYDPSTGIWDVNRMRHEERGLLKTLIITTKVMPSAAGKTLTANARYERLVIESTGTDITNLQPPARSDILDTDPLEVSKPVASFTATPTTGDAPLMVQFTDTSSNNPTNWYWDFDNDGVIDSTEQNPVYNYNIVKNYTVKLTVSNIAGNDIAYHNITVNKPGKPGTIPGPGTGPLSGSGNDLMNSLRNFTASGDPLSDLQKGGGGNGKTYEIEVPQAEDSPLTPYILAVLLIIGLIVIGYFYGIENRR